MRAHLLWSTAVVALISASSAFADGNKVYLNQYDTNQSATINQTGSNNNVGSGGNYFTQSNGGLSGANQLTITQSGSLNWVSHYLTGFQSGSANSANISQAGYNSDVELQQTGTQNGSPYLSGNNGGNYNTIVQDGSANASLAGVYQNGTLNSFDVLQGGINNNTSVTQTGTGGVAFTRQAIQNSAYDPSGRWYPTAGNNNVMTINQATGSLNTVVAVQGGGDSNNMNIAQQGDQLVAKAWQVGGGNVMSAIQTGYYSTALINQTGYNNTALSTQGSYSYATVDQVGNGNQSVGAQYGVLSGYQNVADINQTGDNNYANYYQNGYSNNTSVTQTGNSNMSYNVQSGSGNVANIVQN